MRRLVQSRAACAAACAALAFTAGGRAACAAPAHPRTPSPAVRTALGRLWLGAAWYPEQWPESRWPKDLALMQAAGINVVRVGEFAWSRLEPRQGAYHFGWLARAITEAARHHIYVVIGTPTDAPPAWLTSRYSQVLRVHADGRTAQHGNRRQFSYASPLYRKFCRDIVTRLAKRFGHNPDVIGWQIDNEYTNESYDAGTRRQFQLWLKHRFGTLAALNRDWTTAYWSQTYTAWSQIPLNALPGNPGLMLAHRQFVTATWLGFQRNQLQALRAHIAPRQFVTTNIGGLGWSDNWDHYVITRPLDIAAWDDYVGEGQLDFYRNGAMSDFVRGWKRQDYWVMEAQPGFVDWAPVNNSLVKGGVRAMTWESIGHGADAVLYWQWRSALGGQEQYHGTLVGPDGRPEPLYAEVRRLGGEFKRASAVIAGTSPRSQAALLVSYDSRWAIDFQRQTRRYHQQRVLLDYYRPLENLTHSVDIVSAGAPLAQYRVVFAPSLNVICRSLARDLRAYVLGGGILVLGPRSGMKDQYSRLNVERQPGPLVPLLGARVQQYYALDAPVAVHGAAGRGTGRIWAETLTPRSGATRVLLRYGAGNAWLTGEPAAVERRYGHGAIIYLGTILDRHLMHAFVERLLAQARVRSSFGVLPSGVELMRRVGAGREVVIIINHGETARTVRLPFEMHDVLHLGRAVRTLTLRAQGVAVLARAYRG